MWAALVLAAGMTAAASPGPKWVVEPAPDGIRILEPSAAGPSRELGRAAIGEVRDVASVGEVVYAALAAGGVVVVDAADPARPEVLQRIAEGRAIGKIVLSGDVLVLLETRREAMLFDVADPRRPRPAGSPARPALAGVPPTAPPLAKAEPDAAIPSSFPDARVVGVEKGRAIFDAGTKAGFTEGIRVRVVAQRLVEKPDLVAGGTRAAPSGETTAVLQIEQAEASRSMAQLGRGDVAELGDQVTVAAEGLSERLWLPRRAPFAARVGFHVRPFLGLVSSGKPVGVLVDAGGSYYPESLPVRFEVQAAPVGTMAGGRSAHYPTNLAMAAAYATDHFEIGIGLGLLAASGGNCPYPLCPNPTMTFNQVLRLGSLDGLNVAWQSAIATSAPIFAFAAGRGEINVPLGSRLGIFTAGGAGLNGWGFGEFGVRTYVGGAGARGTVVVSASFGFAAIFDGGEGAVGPSVAFGMEWRL